MSVSFRNLLGIGILACIAIASWYFGREDTAPGDGVAGGPGGPPGYYLRGADIAVMDTQGRLLYAISAEAVEERPDENRTVLSRVHVRYSPAADVPWEARAESGEIPSDERYIELSGDVALSSFPEPDGEPTIIQAPRLRFAPDDFLATTDTEVSLLLGSERLDAVGLSADLKGDRLELESTVHGQFNP